MRVRIWILRLHRWSTFALGVFFLILSVSGTILVFGDELDRLWSPRLFATTPGDIGPDSALRAIQIAEPGRTVDWLWFPRPERPVYIGQFGDGLEGRHYVHVDPGTGRVLGRRGEPAINRIRALHVNFWADLQGALAVGLVGIALLVMMASGLYLWWPGLRKMALGFRVRSKGGPVLVNYDLHNLMGVVTLPLLTLITLTGVGIIFAGTTRLVLHTLWLDRPEPVSRIERLRIEPRPDREMLPLGELVNRARDTIPGFDLMAVVFPRRDDQGLQVRLSQPGVRFRDGLARVLLDPYTGEVIGTLDLRTLTPADAFRRKWLISLHVGSYGGVPVRAIYAIVGLVPVALAGTGLAVWWLRRKGRLATAEKRAAARAA